ncbi:MAG: gluconokinase [Pseudomonadota bacterium]
MGVSGCGKTSVGTALAARAGVAFIDGDDLHPPANIAKMAGGTPLDDDDRAPWLRAVGRALAAAPAPAVIGCSALRRRYRDWIRAEVAEPVHFLHLDAPREVLAGRVAHRRGHFMPSGLLDSQFATLEPLGADELGRVIDIAQSQRAVVAAASAYVAGTRSSGDSGDRRGR